MKEPPRPDFEAQFANLQKSLLLVRNEKEKADLSMRIGQLQAELATARVACKDREVDQLAAC